MSYVIVQLLQVFLNSRNEVFSDCSPCTAHRIPVAAARAASGFTAGYQTDHLVHRRGLRRCYRGCGASVAAARAASGFTAGYQTNHLGRRCGLHRCYRGCGASVAETRAASGVPWGIRNRLEAIRPCRLRLPGGPDAGVRGCWSGAGAWRRVPHRNPDGQWRRRFPRARG